MTILTHTPAAPTGPATFAVARGDATAHHIAAIRNAVQALRGLGSRELVARLLREELDDTMAEIDAMPPAGQRRRCPQPLRLAPGTEA